MSEELILIRHGRSAHVQTAWMDLQGFHRWREAYDAVGILATEAPPAVLRERVERAGVLVCSDALRTVESARLLAKDRDMRDVIVSPLLRERVVSPPALRVVRLPLLGWALAYGIRWIYREVTSKPHAPDDEIARAREAAEWLEGLAREHRSVAVVTHASFRALLTDTLRARGWNPGTERKRSSHWSAWTLTRG